MTSPTQDGRATPLKADVVASKIVHRGEKLTLRVDTLRIGDRSAADKEIVQHAGSTAMIPLTERGTVLLVHQWRAAIGKFTLELPSGTREDDEPPIETAARELREETGYRAETLKPLGGFHPLSGYSEEYSHVYLATGLTFDPLPQDKLEDILVVEIEVDDLRQKCMSGEIDDALTVAAVMRAAADLDDARRVDV